MSDDVEAKVPLLTQLRSFSGIYWIANWMELVERFAYYGVRTVLPVFMVLSISQGGPELTHVQKGTVYAIWALVQSFVPIFTGGFADRYGFKLSIGISTVLKIIGYLLMGYCIALAEAVRGPAAGRGARRRDRPDLRDLLRRRDVPRPRHGHLQAGPAGSDRAADAEEDRLDGLVGLLSDGEHRRVPRAVRGRLLARALLAERVLGLRERGRAQLRAALPLPGAGARDERSGEEPAHGDGRGGEGATGAAALLLHPRVRRLLADVLSALRHPPELHRRLDRLAGGPRRAGVDLVGGRGAERQRRQPDPGVDDQRQRAPDQLLRVPGRLRDRHGCAR